MKILASASVPPSQRLNEADTTNLTAIQRPTAGGFPMNAPYAGTTVAPSPTDAADLALIQAAIRANPAMVRELADAIRREEAGGFKDGYAHGYVDGMQRALAARTTHCPTYCSEDHRGQVTDVDGFAIGLGHERILIEATADHSCYTDEQATATVLVESVTQGSVVTQASRVTLSITAGAEGRYPNGEEVAGWSGSPERARELGTALLAAAAIVESDR